MMVLGGSNDLSFNGITNLHGVKNMTCEKITEAEKIQIAADIIFDTFKNESCTITYSNCLYLARRLHEIWVKRCEDV